MRKLILKMSVSLDLFVGGPNGEIDWIFKSMDDEVTAWIVDSLWQAGVHIMGSRTYHDMAAYWPTSTEPFAAPMNEIPKIIFSKKGYIEHSSVESATTDFIDATRANANRKILDAKPESATSWDNPLVASGDLEGEIQRLKQEPGGDILAHGGAWFAQSLVKSGLIDEYRLLVHPVALGSGLPLFSSLSSPIDLKLVNTTTFNTGVIAQIYQPT